MKYRRPSRKLKKPIQKTPTVISVEAYYLNLIFETLYIEKFPTWNFEVFTPEIPRDEIISRIFPACNINVNGDWQLARIVTLT